MGIRSQSRKQSRKRKSKRQENVKMCVRYTLLIANSLLALLGLLLLAGGVWRIVDNESLREVANEIKDTQEWDDVKEGVDGLEDAVKEASSHKYFNYALFFTVTLCCRARREERVQGYVDAI